MIELKKIKDVTQALGLSRATIYRLMHEKKLPHVRIGGRLRFDPAEVDRFIDERRVSA